MFDYIKTNLFWWFFGSINRSNKIFLNIFNLLSVGDLFYILVFASDTIHVVHGCAPWTMVHNWTTDDLKVIIVC